MHAISIKLVFVNNFSLQNQLWFKPKKYYLYPFDFKDFRDCCRLPTLEIIYCQKIMKVTIRFLYSAFISKGLNKYRNDMITSYVCPNTWSKNIAQHLYTSKLHRKCVLLEDVWLHDNIFMIKFCFRTQLCLSWTSKKYRQSSCVITNRQMAYFYWIYMWSMQVWCINILKNYVLNLKELWCIN